MSPDEVHRPEPAAEDVFDAAVDVPDSTQFIVQPTVDIAALEATADPPRATSPWTASYSVSVQGSPLPVPTELQDAVDAPVGEIQPPESIIEASEDPVSNLPPSVVEPTVDLSTLDAPVDPPRASSPWTPSYSVSVQGSPSKELTESELGTEQQSEPTVQDVAEDAAEVPDEQPVAAALDAPADLPRASSPWTPSYSVLVQGSSPSVTTESMVERDALVDDLPDAAEEPSSEVIVEASVSDDGTSEPAESSNQTVPPLETSTEVDDIVPAEVNDEEVLVPEPAVEPSESLVEESVSGEVLDTEIAAPAETISESKATGEEIPAESSVAEGAAVVDHATPPSDTDVPEVADSTSAAVVEVPSEPTVSEQDAAAAQVSIDHTELAPVAETEPAAVDHEQVAVQSEGEIQESANDPTSASSGAEAESSVETAAETVAQDVVPDVGSTVPHVITDTDPEPAAVGSSSDDLEVGAPAATDAFTEAVEPFDSIPAPTDHISALADVSIAPVEFRSLMNPNRSLSRSSLTLQDVSEDADDSQLDAPPISPRSRLESTASSIFFPGGWFSRLPQERASLDVAQGEFTPVKPTFTCFLPSG
ncbi:hypothetical protein DFH06DRAFT_1335867 [Mycena polygramma]|nr:hypothetical protein DFH06DRAFT_1335867 [Mycena polygramma]